MQVLKPDNDEKAEEIVAELRHINNVFGIKKVMSIWLHNWNKAAIAI